MVNDLIESYCLRPPRLFRDLLPVSGELKVEPEDFEVREIGGVIHSKSGEHLHCWIEKRDLGTDELLMTLSRSFGVSREAIGLAGMKDKRAVTFQWLSLPKKVESRLGEVESTRFRVHRSILHSAKLRRGQLEGNAFRIRIRGMSTPDKARLGRLGEAVSSQGVPNYFGPQRFGRNGNNLRLGMELLRGKKNERNPFLRQLALHSVQSAIFNAVVGKRVQDGVFATLLPGDALLNLKTHMPTTCLKPQVDQSKFDEGRLGIMGPLIGSKCSKAKGEVALREADVLREFGLDLADFKAFSAHIPGQRRAFHLKPRNLVVEEVGGDPLVSFELPAGAYATSVMNEVLTSPLEN